MRRLLRSLGAAMTVGVTFLVVLELIGRTLDPFGISYYPETARYLDTMIIEEPIGYRNRPKLNGYFWGNLVSINSLGLRDSEINPQPSSKEFRILLLGDSVVFGLGISAEDTISHQLQTQLNRNQKDRIYKVINMGVPSYNTEQESIQFQTLGINLHPDLVLLIFGDNDVEPKMWVFERRSSILTNIAQRSYTLSLLALFYWELRLAITGTESRAAFRAAGGEHPGWMVVDAALVQLARLCKDKNTPFVLFATGNFPRLRSIADRISVPLIDLGGLPPNLVVSRVDPHPNPAGAERDATRIRESLERLGIIPRHPA
jgi:hypothetical protein